MPTFGAQVDLPRALVQVKYRRSLLGDTTVHGRKHESHSGADELNLNVELIDDVVGDYTEIVGHGHIIPP